MTLNELKQAYHITRAIDELEEDLLRLRAKAASTVHSRSSEPHSKRISDKTGEGAVTVTKTEQKIQEKRLELERVKNEIYLFLLDIDDVLLQRIIRYRCFECMEWEQVAAKVGGNNSAESVKKMCYRYFRKSWSYGG